MLRLPNKQTYKIAREIRALCVACIFLTRLPMPKLAKVRPRDEGRALMYFPVIGLGLGLLLTVVAVALNSIFSDTVNAALLICIWAAVTGGLHLDGLADSADAWLGGYGNVERSLEIMHDSRCGAAAIIAVSALLSLKFAVLSSVIEQQNWSTLIICPIIGRCAGPLLFLKGSPFYLPYVQPTGIANHFIAHCPKRAYWLSFGMLMFCVLLLGNTASIITVCVGCTLTLYLLRRLMLKRLNGATGDTAGASTEILETMTLLCACM